MNIDRTIIVPVSLVALARALAAFMAPGGVDMFVVPLYTGAVITHYVSSGLIDASFGIVLTDANALFAASGGLATLQQCQDLIAQSIVVDCSIESAYATFARLGLSIGA